LGGSLKVGAGKWAIGPVVLIAPNAFCLPLKYTCNQPYAPSFAPLLGKAETYKRPLQWEERNFLMIDAHKFYHFFKPFRAVAYMPILHRLVS